MKLIIRLITKYSILLALSALLTETWFYLEAILYPIESLEDLNFWDNLPYYSVYFFKVLISILLFIDVRKYGLKFYLIPLVGLFYPLLGVCALLIMIIYKENRPVHNIG